MALLWAFWYVYWYGSAFYEIISKRYKKTEHMQPLMPMLLQNLLLIAAFLFSLTNIAQSYPLLGVTLLANSTFALYLGFAITVLGLGFSIWARRHLGSNWSGTVVLKKGHTLVRSGPYAIVRHPIYTGISFGIVGSAIALNTVSGILGIIFVILFSLLRISAEERLMREKFGKEYEEYSKQVKMFIPWIW